MHNPHFHAPTPLCRQPKDERDMFSAAFKNAMSSRRAAVRKTKDHQSGLNIFGNGVVGILTLRHPGINSLCGS